jgi:hypothetical protein
MYELGSQQQVQEDERRRTPLAYRRMKNFSEPTFHHPSFARPSRHDEDLQLANALAW